MYFQELAVLYGLAMNSAVYHTLRSCTGKIEKLNGVPMVHRRVATWQCTNHFQKMSTELH